MTPSDSSLLAEARLLQDPPRRDYFATVVAPETREVYVDPVRAEDPAAWGRGEPVHEIHFVSSDDARRTGWLVGVRYGPGDEPLGWDTFWIHHVPEEPDAREDALRWGMRLALALEVPLTGEARRRAGHSGGCFDISESIGVVRCSQFCLASKDSVGARRFHLHTQGPRGRVHELRPQATHSGATLHTPGAGRVVGIQEI